MSPPGDTTGAADTGDPAPLRLMASPRSAGPDALAVTELFGPTLQGEGASVGRSAHFLRLAGCVLACRWCDTPFTWDPARVDPARLPRSLGVDTIVGHLAAYRPSRLVVTGGEPLMQSQPLAVLAARLRGAGWTIEVETAGVIAPGPLGSVVDQFNVSIKLSNSSMTAHRRLRPSAIDAFVDLSHSVFKFVVTHPDELVEIDALVRTHHIESSRVFVMAEGTDEQTVLRRSRELAEAVVERGWALTPRWHTLLWGEERGR